jgi:hypothetical protein
VVECEIFTGEIPWDGRSFHSRWEGLWDRQSLALHSNLGPTATRVMPSQGISPLNISHTTTPKEYMSEVSRSVQHHASTHAAVLFVRARSQSQQSCITRAEYWLSLHLDGSLTPRALCTSPKRPDFLCSSKVSRNSRQSEETIKQIMDDMAARNKEMMGK